VTERFDVVVLGAGPAGLMAARKLAEQGRSVVVLERAPAVGGMAGSFEVAGIRVDFGSHRLHRVLEPRLEAELAALLGDDLQRRERRGRISLAGRWLRFPLRLGDVARHLPKRLVAKIGFDTLTAPLRSPKGDDAGSVIEARLGPTVARTFYTPYLRKLWDSPLEDLSTELADRRVSARSGASIVKKALAARKGEGGAYYLYPRRGFGQISEAVAAAAVADGAALRLEVEVTSVDLGELGAIVRLADGTAVEASTVLSSIPAPAIARLAGAPPAVVDAAGRLRHRAMVLAYLVLDADRLTPFDAHYFPELTTPVSRLSEPKNFRDADDPAGVTVVCAELACWEGDEIWTASEEELGRRVVDTLTPLGFAFPPVREVQARRIPRCYPDYTGTYAQDLATVEAWAADQPRLITFGRQGLFAPDNTHHALLMGWDAAESLRPDGTVDRARWARMREGYRSNVVED
jgi:protoporphyrinogen oxidase